MSKSEMGHVAQLIEIDYLRAENERLRAALAEAQAENARLVDKNDTYLADLLAMELYRTENAKLYAALADTAAQLVGAVQRAQEAEAACREIAEVSGETRIWQIATSAIMNATAAK